MSRGRGCLVPRAWCLVPDEQVTEAVTGKPVKQVNPIVRFSVRPNTSVRRVVFVIRDATVARKCSAVVAPVAARKTVFHNRDVEKKQHRISAHSDVAFLAHAFWQTLVRTSGCDLGY